MSIPEPITGSSTMLTSSSIRSLDASTRYMGMIELSPYKKTRNALFQLFDYVASESPPFFGVHVFISIWRIIQFFGPATCANYRFLWGEDTVMSKVWNVISIVFHIIPVFERESIGYIVLYFFAGLFIVAYSLLGASAYVFSHNAKLPSFVPISISLFLATIGYIFSPIVAILSGEIIGRMIDDYHTHLTPVNIVAVVLSFLIVMIYAWLYKSVYSITITFRPDSLMTVVPAVQVQNVLLMLLITLFSGIASQLSKIPCIVLTGVILILYGLSIPCYFSKGGYVSDNHVKSLTATAITSVLLLLFYIICTAMEMVVSEFILLAIVVVWIISYVITHFIYRRYIGSNSRILDYIEDDIENFDIVKSPHQLQNLIVIGFRLAHPICISFQLFKLGIEKYSKNVDIWLLFAKFTAIYPEETQQLTYIAVGMSQNRLKGALAKHTQQQIQSIMRQRETNLLPELKSKLDKVGKQVQATKHKVRYIWDLIIQGNVKELESVVDRAFASIDSSEAEFLHLLRQFPNSRFVARSYARFLRDVVADHAGHKKWAQNVSMLQRGISIAPDKAHDLGLRAFPLLPRNLENQLASQQQTQGVLTDDTLTQEIETDDEQAAIDAELRMSVRESINRLKIPSYKQARILRICSLILLFVVPITALAIYVPIYINSITDPLDFMYYISSLRTRLFQTAGTALHYVYENLNATNPDYGNIRTFPFDSNEMILDQEEPPVSFGSVYASNKQAEYLNSDLALILPELKPMMSFKSSDSTMDKVRNSIFGNTINFTTISDPIRLDGYDPNLDNSDDFTKYNETYSMKSAQAAIMQFMISINDLLALEKIPEDALNRHYISIPINNIRATTDKLSEALTTICDYIVIAQDKNAKIIQISLIVIGIVVPLYYICTCILIIVRITKEKMMIYKCLASLPKNVVSRVADSFKVLKKEEDEEMKTSRTRDEELNKQEENMLKIFATSSDSSRGKATDIIIIVITTILVAGLHIAVTCVFCLFMTNSGEKLMEAAPHVDYTTASYTYDLASQILLMLLPGVVHPKDIYNIRHFELQRVLLGISEWQARGVSRYRAVRYGDESLSAVPFESLGVELHLDETTEPCKTKQTPANDHEVYSCWPSDLLISYCQMKLRGLLIAFTNKSQMFPGNNPTLKHLYHIHQVHIYENYFSPMFENIIPMVVNILNTQVPTITGAGYALAAAAIIIEIILLRFLIQSENRQKFALRLLLHCPGNVVVSNSHITALLSGNFAEKHIDATTRDAEFYDVLVKDMPDSIITMDLEGNIQTANNATNRIYGLDIEELIGQNITTVGSGFKGENPFKDIFEKQDKTSVEKTLIYVKENNTEIHVEVSLTVLGENLLLTTRDVTQTVMYNLLISDEKTKSDRLLSSILPARLVPRVQAGEKNISFAVQSVTILFMDIVSFTPWCGSLPAATVMKTLNLLFKEFDALVAVHPTMTKVKCIGDCYMAAGGIFAEINQPAMHAKDVVEFGLDAIQALEELNVRIEQDLKIRVGVNTGGPIVAGVLGTEKPTFEILGPTINMAQQMEHHGVPMKVHVSRAVYELIYGGNFDVKERGEIEIKNGSVVTYVINPRKNK